MKTRNDGTYPLSETDEGRYGAQRDGYTPQLYHRTEYPVTPPPDYDIAILEPQVEELEPHQQGKVPPTETYSQSNNETYKKAINGTPNMYATIIDKIGISEGSYQKHSKLMGFGFSDANVRRRFIWKVYLILTVQLLMTTGITSIFVFYKPAAILAINFQSWIFIVIFIILLVIAVVCCFEIRRNVPVNYILLGLFTIGESLFFGFISSKYRGDIVIMAMGMAAVLFLGLTLFASQRRFDFTFCGGFMYIAFFFLVAFGITAFLLDKYGEKKQVLYLVYTSMGAIIFFICFIGDTQLMMAGNHMDSVSPEEHILVSLNLYLDTIYVFIYLLYLFLKKICIEYSKNLVLNSF